MYVYTIKPQCTCTARAYSSGSVCLSVCLLLEYLLYCCVLAEVKCLHRVFLDFDSWILLKAFSSKVMVRNYFFAVLALSTPQRLRVHSDLLEETAFEALSLVCAKGPMCKKSIDT